VQRGLCRHQDLENFSKMKEYLQLAEKGSIRRTAARGSERIAVKE
jgi:hypothetical protein